MFIVWNDVFNGVYMEFCRHFFAKIFVKFIAGSTTHTHTYTRRRQKPLDKRRTVEVPKIFVYYGDALPHLCLPQYNKKTALWGSLKVTAISTEHHRYLPMKMGENSLFIFDFHWLVRCFVIGTVAKVIYRCIAFNFIWNCVEIVHSKWHKSGFASI